MINVFDKLDEWFVSLVVSAIQNADDLNEFHKWHRIKEMEAFSAEEETQFHYSIIDILRIDWQSIDLFITAEPLFAIDIFANFIARKRWSIGHQNYWFVSFELFAKLEWHLNSINTWIANWKQTSSFWRFSALVQLILESLRLLRDCLQKQVLSESKVLYDWPLRPHYRCSLRFKDKINYELIKEQKYKII